MTSNERKWYPGGTIIQGTLEQSNSMALQILKHKLGALAGIQIPIPTPDWNVSCTLQGFLGEPNMHLQEASPGEVTQPWEGAFSS